MEQKVISFAKEKYEYNPPELIVARELNIDAKPYKETELRIECTNDKKIKFSGIAVSDYQFIDVITPEFSGVDCNIDILLDLKNADPGSIITGTVYLLTECGDCEVVINIHVKEDLSASGINQLKTLAKSDFKSASRLFKTRDFESDFESSDFELKNVYKGLKKSRNSSLALEELLIKTGKEKIDYTVSETSFLLKDEDSFMCQITISGWGYKEFFVETDSAFILTEKMHFSSEDFVDGSYNLKFTIDKKALKKGYNYATVLISDNFKEHIINIKIDNTSEVKKDELKKEILKQRFLAESVEFFAKYYSKKGIQDEDKSHMEEIISQAKNENATKYTEIVSLFLNLVSGNLDEVRPALEQFIKDKDNIFEEDIKKYNAYNYLLMHYYTDKKNRLSAADNIIRNIKNSVSSWEDISLMVLEDIDFMSDDEIIRVLFESIENGNNNPILYMAIIKLINTNLRLFDEMHPELIEVLHWGAKHGELSFETAERYAFFVKNQKGFSNIVFKDMCALYNTYPTDDMLYTICVMLIRGHKTGSIYHKWYKLGVENKLRITNLYEYFIFSMDSEKNEKIPEIILDYFMYDNSMKLSQKSVLYSYIIRNRYSIAGVYDSYNKKIMSFAFEQLENERISKDLGLLYEHYIKEENIDEQLAYNMSEIIFTYKLTCLEPDIVGVNVRHNELLKEEFYPLIQGSAMIKLYSEDAVIFLTDSNGVRYVDSVDYEISKLIKNTSYIQKIYEYVKDDTGLIINIFNNISSYSFSPEEISDIIHTGLKIQGISTYFKKKLYAYIFRIERENPGLFDDVLNKIEIEYIEKSDEQTYVNYLINHCKYEKALNAIKVFGFEVTEAKNLQKILSSCLKIYKDSSDDAILKLAFFLYKKGRYDEKIIKFLIKNYVGNIDDMVGIYKVGAEKELQVTVFREKIIEYVIISNTVKPGVYSVFYDMLKDKGRAKALIEAFLNMNAYGYMIKGWILPRFMFDAFRKNAVNNKSMACLLAALKELSMHTDLNDEEKDFVIKNIRKLYENNKYFSFFKNYSGYIEIPEDISDYYFIEYTANPNATCKIVYTIVNGTEKNKYYTEIMDDIFEGIRVKKIILFQDEILQYYIIEENNETGEEIITESRSITNDMIIDNEGPENAFHILNTMLVAMNMGEDETFNNLMDEYAYKKGICDAFAQWNMKGKV